VDVNSPGEPDPVRPATSDQARHPGSTVGGGRDDDPSGQPAVDSSTAQAAQPPAARAEHHILEADADVGTDVDRVAESRRSSAAPTTATAASLALEIGDRDVGYRNKWVADDDDIDVFAEGKDQPAAAAAVGRRKRPRRGEALARGPVACPTDCERATE